MGVTWKESNTGLNINYVNTIAVAENAIYAGSNSGGGVYISFDNGKTWTPRNSQLLNTFIKKLIIVEDMVFAGTEAGLYYSNDLGRNWISAGTEFQGLQVYSLIYYNNHIIFFGTNDLYASSDKGTTWIKKPKFDWQIRVTDMAIIDEKLFAVSNAVFLSDDTCNSWKGCNNGLVSDSYMKIFSYKNLLFVGSNKFGVFKSTDLGNQWFNSSLGLPSSNITNLHFTNTKVYATTENHGFFTSVDGCRSWQLSNTWNLSNTVGEMASDGVIIYANILHNDKAKSTLYKSTDDGENWYKIANGLPHFVRIPKLLIKNNIVYAALNSEEGIYGLFISQDSGATWSWLKNGWLNYRELNSIAITDEVYVAATKSHGIYRYEVGVGEWAHIPSPDGSNYIFKELIYHNGVLYGGDYGSISLSSDLGLTWEINKTGLPAGYINTVLVYKNFVIVGHEEYGVYFSKDGGKTFKSANKGLNNFSINKLYLNNNAVYVTTKEGVYYFEDINNFETLTSIPYNAEFNSFVIQPNPANTNSPIAIKGNVEVKYLNIYDVVGRNIFTDENITKQNDKIIIDLQKLNLPTGIYFLTLRTEAGAVTRQFAVVR